MSARSVKLVLLVLTGVLFVSCSPQTVSSYRFRPLGYYATAPEQTKIVVSLWDQKAWLLGKEGRVILETDVSTGVPGFETLRAFFRFWNVFGPNVQIVMGNMSRLRVEKL